MSKTTNIAGTCVVLGIGFWMVKSPEFSKLIATGPQLRVWVDNMPNVPQPMTVLHIQSKENRQLTLATVTADNKKLPLENAFCLSAHGNEGAQVMQQLGEKLSRLNKPEAPVVARPKVMELGDECRLVVSFFPNMTPVRVDVETTLGSSSYDFD
jgi:hypothetical protein